MPILVPPLEYSFCASLPVVWLPRAVPTVPRVPPTPPVTEVRVPSALIVAWVDPFCRNLPSQLFAEVRPFADSVAGSISTAVPSKVALPSPRSLVAPGRAPAVAGAPALGDPLTIEELAAALGPLAGARDAASAAGDDPRDDGPRNGSPRSNVPEEVGA